MEDSSSERTSNAEGMCKGRNRALMSECSIAEHEKMLVDDQSPSDVDADLESNGEEDRLLSGDESTDDDQSDFSVTWINVHYHISLSWWARFIATRINRETKPPHTKILHSVTGQMKSGRVTALLGPSGCGKTILFDCLVSRRIDGLSGRIRYRSNKLLRNIKVAYVQQTPTFSSQLTVRELIRYSSKLQNFNMNNVESPHETITSQVLKLLGLEVCADNLAGKCSGGQMKRISIAVELVTTPSILILDEPTSGLDSTAASNLVQLLKSIANGTMYARQVAIIASIHQPSWETLNIFDNVIMMSKLRGQVIYDGAPGNVPDFLSSNGITYQDAENPADVLMELACGSHGTQGIEKAVEMTRKRSRQLYADRMDVEGDSLAEKIATFRKTFLKSAIILGERSLLISLRDRYLLAIRLLASLGLIPVLYMIFENVGGHELADGCPINLPSVRSARNNLSLTFLSDISQMMDYASAKAYLNASSVIVLQMICFFVSIIGDLFAVSRDFAMVKSELLHSWYSLESYVAASIFTEFIVSAIFSVTLLTVPWYFLTEQKLQFWRIVVVCTDAMLLAVVGMSIGGTLASIFLGHSFATCVYVAFLIGVPQIILAGHLIIGRDLPLVLYNTFYLLPLAVASQATMVALYGFERCHNLHMIERYVQLVRLFVDNIRDTSMDIWSLTGATNVTGLNYHLDHEYERFIETIVFRYKYTFYNAKGDSGSLVMATYDYDDADLGKNIFWLVYQLVTLRFVYYLIYRHKVYARH